MSVAEKLTYMTVEEYLEMEAHASVKHEYVDGLVLAMTGATKRHNNISINMLNALYNFLDGTPCRVYIEAVRVRVTAANCFYYPDVMVACDECDDESVYTEEPVLIVEVLSPSTAATDRREKLINYMKIPALQEYLIVHQRRKHVELYRKNESGHWDATELVGGEDLVLESMPKGKLTISVDSIYKNVRGTRFKDGSLEVREEADDGREWLSADEVAAIDW